MFEVTLCNFKTIRLRICRPIGYCALCARPDRIDRMFNHLQRFRMSDRSSFDGCSSKRCRSDVAVRRADATNDRRIFTPGRTREGE